MPRMPREARFSCAYDFDRDAALQVVVHVGVTSEDLGMLEGLLRVLCLLSVALFACR